MRKAAMIMSLSLASAGCATFPSFPIIKQEKKVMNYVAPEVSLADSEKIAADMARFLANQLPPARTTIGLSGSSSMFNEMLVNELAWRGFGISEGGSGDDEQVVQLRYFVTILDTGIVVRMRYNAHVAGRFYQRGTPLLGGVYVVRGLDK